MSTVVKVPDGVSGVWEVRTFEVTESDASRFNMRALFQMGGRIIFPGTYKQLLRNGDTVMSNTPAELADHQEVLWEAEKRGGDILINGLGLGVVLVDLLKLGINSVTVIEKSEDVIALVEPTFENAAERLNIATFPDNFAPTAFVSPALSVEI